MGRRVAGGPGGGGGSFAIADTHFFDDNTARDAYFTAHEKTIGVLISVGAGYEQWDGTTWIDKTAIVRGPVGADGTDGSFPVIHSLPEKTTPSDADLIIIEDSEADYTQKKVRIGNLPGGGGAGRDGKSVLNDEGVPGSGIGTIGDFYIDTLVTRIYGPKTEAGWGTGVLLVGADGQDGSNGADGYGVDGKSILNGMETPGSEIGVSGDFYIDTTEKTIYGPKTGSGWGNAISLIGPAGQDGADGATLPVADSVALVKDPADPSRQVRIDAGAIATGTIRAIIMPNLDVDLTPDTGTFPANSSVVLKSLYGPNTFLIATEDNTPTAISVGEQTLLGRLTGESITALSVSQLKTLLGIPTTDEIFLSCAGGWSPVTLPDGGFFQTETPDKKINFRGTKMVASPSRQNHCFGHPLPSKYNGGTITATPYFYVPSSTDASNHTIILGLQGLSLPSGSSGDGTAYGTAQEVIFTVTSSIAGQIIKGAASAAITIGGVPSAGNWVQWRTYRKEADTYTGDIILLGWMITFTMG